MFQFAVAVLATWRVAHLVAREDGPGDVLARIRGRLGHTTVGKMMDCLYCLSVWVAAPAALWMTRVPWDWLMTLLAVSGAACLLDRLVPAAPEPVVIQPLDPVRESEGRHELLRTTTDSAT